jgi:hypothetical protein
MSVSSLRRIKSVPAKREDPELFRVGDYVLLLHAENSARNVVGMITRFTGHDLMDVFVPSSNLVLHRVPIDVDQVLPIKFQGIRGRHCETFVDESDPEATHKQIIYWDGDHVIESEDALNGVCERVSFSASQVSRDSIKSLHRVLDKLNVRELRDRLRELGIDVMSRDGTHLLSMAELRKRYEDQMLTDIRTSLTRCDQLVRAAQSQCDKLEASCEDERLPWDKKACKKRVAECRLDAALPKPLAKLATDMQQNANCLSTASGNATTCALQPSTVSEDLNFFNTNCSLMRPVADKYATRAQLSDRTKQAKRRA